MHSSVAISPVEIIEMQSTEFSPLIKKVVIKVCYVSDEPNRNRSVITKDVAKTMASSLRGCPIVGLFNEEKQDFEEHSRILEIEDGEIKLKDATKPYGFVDLNAKVWFQKFLDDNSVEREYLVTEGYIWTDAYPESQRILDKGNNQSMELDEKTINISWAKADNSQPRFFIINEAIIKKLCILGEDVEPCFEGASISEFKLSFEDDFKNRFFSMMTDFKTLIEKGGDNEVFTTYAVEIGCALWDALYEFIRNNYPDDEERWHSKYSIRGIFEEGNQKFAILQDPTNLKFYRLNFEFSDENGFVASDELIEVVETFEPNISEEAFSNYVLALKPVDEEPAAATEPIIEEPAAPVTEEPVIEQPQYTLEEIPEYVELTSKYSALLEEVASLKAANEELTAQNTSLTDFKKQIEKKEKEDMIGKFYMLSDEDKKDVLANIDTYSLKDIEAELSIICVRNKLNLSDDPAPHSNDTYVFNLDGTDPNADAPDWLKAVLTTEKNMN